MKVSDEIVEKLTKILRLANDKAATQGEIEAALGKAKAMAMKHGIDLATVSLEDPSSRPIDIEVTKEQVGIRSKKFQLYHQYIWRTLQEVFGVRVILHYNRLTFLGETTDVLICKMLLPWLEDVFYSTYYQAKTVGLVISCAADKRGIYNGLYRGLVEANKREEAKLNKQEAGAWALVLRCKKDVIEQRMAVDFPSLRNIKSRATQMDARAFNHGYNEGKKINLHQAGSGQVSKQLK